MTYEMIKSNDYLITHTGSALVGKLLKKTALYERLNGVKLSDKQSCEINNAEMAFAYLGTLCQGKPEYDAIEEFRGDSFFAQSLGIRKVPSSSILRQRFDSIGTQANEIIADEACSLLRTFGVSVTSCYDGRVALDIDVSPFDNSKTKKEGVSYTYKGFDGYAPIFAYLGEEGWNVGVELRSGSTHCQCNTEEFLANAILNAKKVTDKPILVRMDSGNDSVGNIIVMQQKNTRVDYIIKRNLRKENLKAYYALALENGTKLSTPREGKDIYVIENYFTPSGAKEKVRTVSFITVRTMTACGQLMMEPEISVESFYTSMFKAPETDILELYHKHGTSEQFHSEIKTDLDLERLPSGKFATNALILQLGVFAYNLLRMIGQESLKDHDSPATKRRVKRRRVRTVIQNYMTIASKLVNHAKKQWLKFGCNSPWFASFKRIYLSFS